MRAIGDRTVEENEYGNKTYYIEVEGRKKLVHRDNNLPAVEAVNGYREWRVMGQLHRDDNLPAIESTNGVREWWVHGKRHRTNGPALVARGSEKWYVDGKLHRVDGPAVIENDGRTKEWFIRGKPHRLDGPAKELSDGRKMWYIDGVRYETEEAFEQKRREIYKNLLLTSYAMALAQGETYHQESFRRIKGFVTK